MADQKRILVVGDVMEDHYVHVKTVRKAPEADIPVWDEVSREIRPGGAWNVAENIASLMPEAETYICGLMEPNNIGRANQSLSMWVSGEAMRKVRYVDNGKIIFRSDNFSKFYPGEPALLFKELRANDIGQFDAVVFSDYDKGTLTEEMVQFCRSKTGLVIVDSKRRDLSLFFKDSQSRKVILKVNHSEWAAQASNEIPIEAYFDYVVVTKGKDGATLRQFDSNESRLSRNVVHSEEFPTKRVWAVDVTGCGDTHTAAMTVSLVQDADVRKAVRFGNEKASQAVQVFGTTVVV